MNHTDMQEGRDLQSVMYVDDDEDMLQIVEVALAGFGRLSLETCASWSQARARIAAFRPDLMLLDVMMPDTDGVSALLEMQADADLRHIPVVFLTAHLQPDELARLTMPGVLGIITKPFQPDRLAGQLRALWQGPKETC